MHLLLEEQKCIKQTVFAQAICFEVQVLRCQIEIGKPRISKLMTVLILVHGTCIMRQGFMAESWSPFEDVGAPVETVD